MVVTMKLRRGPHRIGVGVRDEIGVAVSLLLLEVDIDSPAMDASKTREADSTD